MRVCPNGNNTQSVSSPTPRGRSPLGPSAVRRADYTIEVSAAGTYALAINAAAANVDQVFHIKSGNSEPVTVKVPWSKGLWDTTPAAEIQWEKGPQTLRIPAPFQRSIAVQCLKLNSR